MAWLRPKSTIHSVHTPHCPFEKPGSLPRGIVESQLKADSPLHGLSSPGNLERVRLTIERQFSLKETCGFSRWDFCLPDIQRMANAGLSASIQEPGNLPACLLLDFMH